MRGRRLFCVRQRDAPDSLAGHRPPLPSRGFRPGAAGILQGTFPPSPTSQPAAPERQPRWPRSPRPPVPSVELALASYSRHPAEIDAEIGENHRAADEAFRAWEVRQARRSPS